MPPKLPPSAAEFIERLGLATEAEGLPRIAGRLMALLLLLDRACTLEELTQRLGVSHGSVSTNTRLLESLGVVERASRPGDRRVYYRLGSDPYGRLLEGYLARMRRIAGIVEDARRSLPREMNGAKGRLAEMGRFYDVTIRHTEETLADLRRREPTRIAR